MLVGRSKKDNALFERLLSMPYMYYQIVHKIYPKSLAAAPYALHKIIDDIHTVLGRNMKHDATFNKLAIYGGIPPQHVTEEPKVTGKKECLDTLNSLVKNFGKFMETGVVLYIHSPFEASAIAAGALLCRTAHSTDVSFKMVAYPKFVEVTKDFGGDHKDLIEKMRTVDLLCLYMVGKEYTTEFNMSNFKALVASRKVDNKVTVICSHMSPEDFCTRYGAELCISALQFTDDNEINNFKALRRVVEG